MGLSQFPAPDGAPGGATTMLACTLILFWLILIGVFAGALDENARRNREWTDHSPLKGADHEHP